MAFVTVDNAGGILNHGGQTAWTAISDTRVALVTITADFKALVQEINFTNNETVVGTPSFIKQISGAQATYHMRPKVRAFGVDSLFVMIPSAWSQPITPYMVKGTDAHGAPVASWQAPSAYDGFIMTRSADGNYSVASSISLDFTSVGNSSWMVQPSSPFEITEVTATEIIITRAKFNNTSNDNSLAAQWQTFNIVIAGNILQSYTKTDRQTGTGFTSRLRAIYDLRYRRAPDRSRVLCALEGIGYTHYFDQITLEYRRVAVDPYVTDSQFYSYTEIAGSVSLKGFLPIDGVSKCTAVGGYGTGANQLINGTLSSPGQTFYFPLDTAWVTNTVMCIAGTPDNGIIPTADLKAISALNDVDMCAAIALGSNGDALPLYLSFRDVGNLGAYSGVYDPIKTPYYYRPYMNSDNNIHRIDDSHFWIIGCFMADANATPKIGVITVNV